MPEYTLLTLIALVAVVAIELAWLRTGLFRTTRYWIAMAIVLGFQVLVDGWLTKLDAPIVNYAPEHFLGVRAPWDIPIEDFGFGIAMVTLTMLIWEALGRRDARRAREREAAAAAAAPSAAPRDPADVAGDVMPAASATPGQPAAAAGRIEPAAHAAPAEAATSAKQIGAAGARRHPSPSRSRP